jgi:acetyl-CoA C-acetyltransferase
MRQAWIAGVGDTPFGRLEGMETLDLMADAAAAALADAGAKRGEVDGLLTGYSTALPHLMLATLFAEHFGLAPTYCHAIQLGGATGCALVMLAKLLVESGQCRSVVVVAGENRLTSPGGRDSAIQTLAQVGHAEHEVPYGATIPAYYGLLASAYMHAFGISEEDLAELAVLMRAHAARHPGAHLREPITVADVMASRPIATPLKLLDCCPISDGAVAFLVTADRERSKGVRLAGAGQAHTHQHISAAPGGRFGVGGKLPFNTHGGLLSFGHSGVAGGMAHLAEVVRQMTGAAAERQMPQQPEVGFVHGDGGVLSSHVSLVLARG